MRRSVALATAISLSMFALQAGVGLTEDVALSVRCTPGYRPCIPLKSSDVDCYGGSGNGPRYTKRGVVYKVTGSDRYRLDADRDGWGCER